MALTRLYNDVLFNPQSLGAIYETFENVEVINTGDIFKIYRIWSDRHNIPDDDNLELVLMFHQKTNNSIYIEFNLKPL